MLNKNILIILISVLLIAGCTQTLNNNSVDISDWRRYFPCNIGAEWKYNDSFSSGEAFVISVVDGKDLSDGTIRRVFKYGSEGYFLIEANNSGVYQYGEYDITSEGYAKLLFPLEIGRSWKGIINNTSIEAIRYVESIENVSLPIGTYESYKITTLYTFEGKSITINSWYAKDVGLIKMIHGSRISNLESFKL